MKIFDKTNSTKLQESQSNKDYWDVELSKFSES